MSTMEMTKADGAAMLERVVVGGDLSKLSPAERLLYYRQVCESIGLNPLTRPFQYITLNNRLTLYASRDATDQLRTLKKVSITKLERELTDGIYVVTAYAKDKDERTDSSTGAVPVENLRGEAKANAMMKAETKAKRRVTLSICGLGMLDETETESIPGARPVPVDPLTGELPTSAAPASAPDMAPVDLFDTQPTGGTSDNHILIGRITARFQVLKTNATMQVKMWEKHVGPTAFLSPAADVAALQDLLTALGEKA